MKIEELSKVKERIEGLVRDCSTLKDRQKRIERIGALPMLDKRDYVKLTAYVNGFAHTEVLLPTKIKDKTLKMLEDDTKKAIEEMEREIENIRVCGIEVKEVENE